MSVPTCSRLGEADEYLPDRYIKGDVDIFPLCYAGLFAIIGGIIYFGR